MSLPTLKLDQAQNAVILFWLANFFLAFKSGNFELIQISKRDSQFSGEWCSKIISKTSELQCFSVRTFMWSQILGGIDQKF